MAKVMRTAVNERVLQTRNLYDAVVVHHGAGDRSEISNWRHDRVTYMSSQSRQSHSPSMLAMCTCMCTVHSAQCTETCLSQDVCGQKWEHILGTQAATYT